MDPKNFHMKSTMTCRSPSRQSARRSLEATGAPNSTLKVLWASRTARGALWTIPTPISNALRRGVCCSRPGTAGADADVPAKDPTEGAAGRPTPKDRSTPRVPSERGDYRRRAPPPSERGCRDVRARWARPPWTASPDESVGAVVAAVAGAAEAAVMLHLVLVTCLMPVGLLVKIELLVTFGVLRTLFTTSLEIFTKVY